ncbi:MAG: transporter substrate-binding domain-containing protein [Synergistaceae bacterium]|nr:transporter substrate-binding domain-containing protein [Synergistaceae bacterium]
MKKVLAVILVLAVFAGRAFAEEKTTRKIREGFLRYAGISTEEYSKFVEEADSQNFWDYYNLADPRYSAYTASDAEYEYVPFDSLTDMIMALDAGKIDRMEMVDCTGAYFLRQGNNSEKYINYQYLTGLNSYLSIGFKKGSKWIKPFNAAIKAMKEDDTLLLLTAKCIDYVKDDLNPITFEKFPDADTVKIAVTGDLPPIDYVAADGTPAGFNTAILAEIGRRLKVNIEILSVSIGARAAAISSGRVDGVFVFWADDSADGTFDTPEGVALTESYCTYDTCVYIGKSCTSNSLTRYNLP